MSNRELLLFPAFDVLKGDSEVYMEFGKPLAGLNVNRQFETVVDEARTRIQETFGRFISFDEGGISTLEELIDDMWRGGWNPEEGNVELFVRDFGASLAASLGAMYSAEYIFRSQINLVHMSLWWPKQHVEAFPFHRASKRFLRREGESLTYFSKSIAELLKLNATDEVKA